MQQHKELATKQNCKLKKRKHLQQNKKLTTTAKTYNKIKNWHQTNISLQHNA